MVNELEFHVSSLKQTYIEYLKFLNKSLNEVINKPELKEYLNYVQDRDEKFNSYINDLNYENSIHLFGIIGGFCRYFSEFNWFDDNIFYVRAVYFRDKLTEDSHFIYNYYQTHTST
jgi:hypothetical protein